jgi:uncharacterized protein YjbJ (UPF0337 family)
VRVTGPVFCWSPDRHFISWNRELSGTFLKQEEVRKLHHQQEHTMNWDRIEGNWKQFTGKIKEQWGELTDDDIAQINGNREQLEGKIQSRYGYAKDQVRKDIDDWLGRQ